MARLTREESKVRTRELLLDSAKSEFARVGYGGASADIIAEKAGFSKGAFYSNFDSKEDVFLELLKRHMEHEAEVIGRLVDGAKDTNAVLNGVEEWFLEMQKDAEWQLLSIELILHSKRNQSFAKKFNELHSKHQGELGKLIKSIFSDAGKKVPEKPELMAQALMGLSHGLALVKSQKDDGSNIGGKLTVLFLKGLLAISERK